MKKDDFRTRNLKYLLDVAAKTPREGPVNEYGAHTLVKLVALASYSNQFCTIVNSAKAKGLCDAGVYVDLFAGPGLVRIPETGDVVAGSPIAALSGGKFDYAVLVEKRQHSADALKSRLSTFLSPSRFDVINDDCNTAYTRVADEIGNKFKKPVILAFIDPEGIDISIQTMYELGKRFHSVDFIINATAGMGRITGTIKDGVERNLPKFKRFVGENLADVFVSEVGTSQMTDAYRDVVLAALGRPATSSLPVFRKGGHLLYTLIFLTQASGGGTWMKIWEYIAKQLRGWDEDRMKQLLDIVMNRAGTIDSFLDNSIG